MEGHGEINKHIVAIFHKNHTTFIPRAMIPVLHRCSCDMFVYSRWKSTVRNIV